MKAGGNEVETRMGILVSMFVETEMETKWKREAIYSVGMETRWKRIGNESSRFPFPTYRQEMGNETAKTGPERGVARAYAFRVRKCEGISAFALRSKMSTLEKFYADQK
jgi:hypothetical protein